MANNLIKWWKTKFMNKYKQLSGSSDFSGGNSGRPRGRSRSHGRRMSDTQKLLESELSTSDLYLRYTAAGDNNTGNVNASDTAFVNHPTANTPSIPSGHSSPNHLSAHPTDNIPNNHKHQLNVQNFSYVSMQGENTQCASERQEFSFTLYDFDGHGKITKDDVTGLVTTIYDTIRSCVQVPYYGSKTIKVKLIISPNQKNTAPTTNPVEQSTETRKNDPKSEDITKETRKQTKERRVKKDFCCNLICNNVQNNHCYESNCVQECKKSEADNGSVKMSCNSESLKQCRELDANSRHWHHSYRQRQHNAHSHLAICPRLVCPLLCTKTWRTKHRSSSLQRQELLKIIQANMDKNNLRFQTNSRKRCRNEVGHIQQNVGMCRNETGSDHGRTVDLNLGLGLGLGLGIGEENLYQNSSFKLPDLASMMSSNNYLVNLSSLQTADLYNTNNSKYVPYCDYDTAALLNAVVNMNKHVLGRGSNNSGTTSHLNHSTLNHNHCKCKRHRLRTNDLMQLPLSYRFVGAKRHSLNKRNSIFNNEFTRRPKTFDKTYNKSKYSESKFEQFPQRRNSKKISRVFLNHSPTPHHLKHRNRKEDQARAMAQVVRWLEKEVSTNISIKAKLEKKNSKSKAPEKKTPVTKTNNPSGRYVQKHEHHHVHKHIHHHYHHFQQEQEAC